MAQLARGDTAGQQVKNMLKVSLPRAVLLLPLPHTGISQGLGWCRRWSRWEQLETEN